MPESVEEFLARGGEIEKVADGVTSLPISIKECLCGCEGVAREHIKLAGHRQRSGNTPAMPLVDDV